MSSNPTSDNLYAYKPSTILPIIFAVLVGWSVAVHFIQNFYFRFWRITFFLFWGGLCFTVGWVLRAIAAHNPGNSELYIAQTVFIYAAPPIYAAAEYNILGRLMYYLPMHAPLNPAMVKYFFIYIGALVEALTAAGAARMATNDVGSDQYKNGGILLAISTTLQGAVELGFVSFVVLMHQRAKRAGMLSRNVKIVCLTLYGCSALILFRSVFRAVEAFTQYASTCEDFYCGSIVKKEWYLYALEAAPMVLYTVWFNVLHPGRYLPKETKRYLDVDGKTERLGPAWVDERPWYAIAADPFNWLQDDRSGSQRTRFWEKPGEWPRCDDGSFALGTAYNRRPRRREGSSMPRRDDTVRLDKSSV